MSDQERNDEYEDLCMLCKRPESVTGKMFKLYQDVCLCNDCMHMTMDTMSQMDFMQGMPPMYGGFPGMQMTITPGEEDADIVEGEEDAGSRDTKRVVWRIKVLVGEESFQKNGFESFQYIGTNFLNTCVLVKLL